MPVNYFSYFSDVEEYFVQKRGKNLLISPLDWSLIETWKEEDIPLHIVLRGIDRSFENIRESGKKSAPTTLSYCHGAVMEAFHEFQESRIGKNIDEEELHNLDDQERSKVLRLLEGLSSSLGEIEVSSDIGLVVLRMEELSGELGRAEAWNPAELERELGSVAGSLVGILKEDLDEQVLKNLEKEIKSSLKLYKKRVSKDVYRQLFDKQLKQRILDLFGLPEFSLMSMEGG